MFKHRLTPLFVLLFVILPLLGYLLNLYIDWLFFQETGYKTVFTTRITAQIVSALIFAFTLLAFFIPNLLYAEKGQFPYTSDFINAGTIRLQRDQALQMIRPLGIFAALLFALIAAQLGATQWEKALLFLNAQAVGNSDPVIGKDIGFYLFSLPFFELVRAYLNLLLLVTMAAVLIIYYLRGGITMTIRGPVIAQRVKQHTGFLVAIFSLVIAAGFYLERFSLLYNNNGSFQGAGYVDVSVSLTVLSVLMLLTPFAGLATAFGLWKGLWRMMLVPPLVILATYFIGIHVYPSLLHKFKVAPNELALEMPYIKHHIDFTRFGYDLDKIETVPFDVDTKLTAADIENNEATIKNIRLWDHAPLLRTYSQLQQIRTYYRFFDVDNDRYMINGNYTQVMLSPRELSYQDLPSKTWINERLIFTHGNGLTMGPVSRISREGLPEFHVKDIPPVSLADIKVTRPEIYFGELSNDYVIVKTKVPEFSYPTDSGNISTSYAGQGGVNIGSLLRKLAFALYFRTEKILLSSDITAESKIIYNRNVLKRVNALAPFLRFDGDPYMVVDQNGHLKWIIDAYTHSSHMPYSRPLRGGINYMRNAVKACVDAYDGSVEFYTSDPDDVVLKTYANIFPVLFKPLSDMPDGLRNHIRYAHQFLQIQASMFATYHMTDPKVFYNKENLWEIPALADQTMEPYYTVMKLPGEKQEEYILLLPFTPSRRDNLAAWLTARCDGENYGKILAYTFPRDRLIYGPKQIDARINQDSYISQQLTLWSQRGTEVIRGSMLVIPIEKSLLYVQPLFLAADRAGLPELRRVIVAFGDDVVMEETLELALQRIFGGKSRTEKATVTSAKTDDSAPSVSNLAKEAMSVYQRATNMQRQGDWQGYGEELRKLEQLLKQLAR